MKIPFAAKQHVPIRIKTSARKYCAEFLSVTNTALHINPNALDKGANQIHIDDS
jgi:hypothetical protein